MILANDVPRVVCDDGGDSQQKSDEYTAYSTSYIIYPVLYNKQNTVSETVS